MAPVTVHFHTHTMCSVVYLVSEFKQTNKSTWMAINMWYTAGMITRKVKQITTCSGDGSWDPSRPHSVYIADITAGGRGIGPRRTFATCSTGIPDGLKTDEAGNLFIGCGDGVHVSSPSGRELGVILVGGVANFALTKNGIVMLQETKITHVSWLIK